MKQEVVMQNVEAQIEALQSQVAAMEKRIPSNKISMIVFSGDMDKVLAAFVIATGAVAMGMDVVMFFTFWGTPILRDKTKKARGKDTMGKMFGAMLPKGTPEVKLSKMNMGGMGTAMMAPDYAWWHGFYECKNRYNRFMEEARHLIETGQKAYKYPDFPNATGSTEKPKAVFPKQ